ncbi:aldo/keto reductase [Sphingomonas oligophenolica]
MAYSPVEQGRPVRNNALSVIASELGLTPAQVALAWTLRQPHMIVIPKAGSIAHLRENRAAPDTSLLRRRFNAARARPGEVRRRRIAAAATGAKSEPRRFSIAARQNPGLRYPA